MSYPRLVIVLISLVLLFACEKTDSVGNAPGKHLKRIETGDLNSISYRIFYYDAQDRLTSIVDSNSVYWKSSILYNSANQPVRINSVNPNNPGDWRVDSLLYNGQSQVVKKIFTSPVNASFKTSNAYKYDDKGRLIVDSAYGFSTGDIQFVFKYNYDDNNNIAQIQNYYKTGGALQESDTKTVTYELRTNPYTNLNLLVYFLRSDEPLVLARNNPLTAKFHSNGTPVIDINYQYEYEYLLDGTPKKVMVNYSKNGAANVKYPITFIYE